MEKTKVRLEYDNRDILPMVRPHREFYGRRGPKSKGPPMVELEFDEDEEVYAFLPKDGEELQGRSVQLTEADNLILTADPGLYGDEDTRKTSGLNPLTKLNWGEWNFLGDLNSL